MKGNLIPFLAEPVDSDHIGQTDDRNFSNWDRDDQLYAIVAGRFFGKQRQYPAAAQVNGRASYLPCLGIDFFGAGNVTCLNGQARGHSEIIAQRLRRDGFPGNKMETARSCYAFEPHYQVHSVPLVLDSHVAVSANFQIIDFPGIGKKNQFQKGRFFFN